MKSVVRRVCVVLVALAVMTSVASADPNLVRVNYDYATTGIGTGSGIWSVTIDSGLIPDGLDPNGNEVYLDPNDAVTFMAAMATPAFLQRDALLDGDVLPSVEDMPGLVGWANDANDNGQGTGMEWVFYGPNDIVTLRAITEDYKQYTWEIQTVLASGESDDLSNKYYCVFSFADNPEGLDAGNGEECRTVSWWGDVDQLDDEGNLGAGHRHSVTKFKDDLALGEGQDICRDGKEGYLGGDANGDGIGVSLGFRKIFGDSAPGNASFYFYDVIVGGDVFADPNAITQVDDTVKWD